MIFNISTIANYQPLLCHYKKILRIFFFCYFLIIRSNFPFLSRIGFIKTILRYGYNQKWVFIGSLSATCCKSILLSRDHSTIRIGKAFTVCHLISLIYFHLFYLQSLHLALMDRLSFDIMSITSRSH